MSNCGNNASFTPAPECVFPEGTLEITENGIFDVTQYASADVNVSGGGGGMTLLATESLGLVNYSSGNEASIGKSITVSGVNDYDLLVVEVTADTADTRDKNLIGTVATIFLHSDYTGVADYDNAPKTPAISTSVIDYMVYANGNIASKANSGTAICGIYPKTANISDGVATIDFYAKYNYASTGTINNNYTAQVYGINLYDLIP